MHFSARHFRFSVISNSFNDAMRENVRIFHFYIEFCAAFHVQMNIFYFSFHSPIIESCTSNQLIDRIEVMLMNLYRYEQFTANLFINIYHFSLKTVHTRTNQQRNTNKLAEEDDKKKSLFTRNHRWVDFQWNMQPQSECHLHLVQPHGRFLYLRPTAFARNRRHYE